MSIVAMEAVRFVSTKVGFSCKNGTRGADSGREATTTSATWSGSCGSCISSSTGTYTKVVLVLINI